MLPEEVKLPLIPKQGERQAHKHQTKPAYTSEHFLPTISQPPTHQFLESSPSSDSSGLFLPDIESTQPSQQQLPRFHPEKPSMSGSSSRGAWSGLPSSQYPEPRQHHKEERCD